MRKQLGIAAAAFLCAGITGLCTYAALLGDTDNDGKRGGSDVKAVQNFVLGKNASLSGNADMNGDNAVNGFDLGILKRMVRVGDTGQSSGVQDFGTAPNVNATMFEDFRDGKADYFFASDGWTNGNPFDCVWTEDNTKLSDGALHLTIDKDYSGKYNYTGAEYRTSDHYHYGYYETSMKAIKNDGVVSSFFTYTGPSEDNPWDEIDIEILGKDTTKVQLNYYTNGVGNHEVMYDLGFDASEGYHTYGFDWQPDHITWYVDGKAVYTAYSNIPSTPGRIMMNAWPGIGVDEWLKPFNGNTPLTASYQWVTFDGQTAPSPDTPSQPGQDSEQIITPTGKGSGVTDDFEGTGTDWAGRGTVKYGFVTDFVHGGSQALYVTDRTASWHGVSVASNELVAGGSYSISAFAGFTDTAFSSMGYNIGLQYNLNGSTEYAEVASADGSCGQWTELKSDFTIPAGATSISLYVQSTYNETPGAADMISFYLDDVVLTKNGGDNNNNNNNNNNNDTPSSGVQDLGTVPNTSATMYDNFRSGSSKYFFASDGWTNGNPFDCVWTENNTKISDGALHLTIDKDYSGKYNYTGAEYRTSDHYHYGYYETSMKAIKNNGVVSSFFTYTGPSENNPWDEIDIEILGKDTTKVQLNYYTNGVGNHEYMYDLGFDASLAYHTYGFDWQPDHITWYVDGKAVYTAYSNIPSTPGRIMMNAWPGTGVNEWLAPFDGRTPLTASYQWVTYNKQ